MADLFHSVAVVFSREDRGKTCLQWQVSPEAAHRFAAEFRERFGEPVTESTTDAAAIDEGCRVLESSSGHVVVGRG